MLYSIHIHGQNYDRFLNVKEGQIVERIEYGSINAALSYYFNRYL